VGWNECESSNQLRFACFGQVHPKLRSSFLSIIDARKIEKQRRTFGDGWSKINVIPRDISLHLLSRFSYPICTPSLNHVFVSLVSKSHQDGRVSNLGCVLFSSSFPLLREKFVQLISFRTSILNFIIRRVFFFKLNFNWIHVYLINIYTYMSSYFL